MDTKTQSGFAKTFRALHRPGHPLILTNVYDAATASIVLANPNAHAVATASYAIAATQGVADEDMTLAQNLAGVRNVVAGLKGSVERALPLPLTVDLQDGYADVGESVRAIIQLGAVGCNIEDVECATQRSRGVEEAAARIREAMEAARDSEVPDFVVNARTDVMGFDGTIEDVIERGKAYLTAGATTAFVWGGKKGGGLSGEEVRRICAALDGRVSVLKRFGEDSLSVRELRESGVARISVGPGLYRAAMAAFKDGADGLLLDQ